MKKNTNTYPPHYRWNFFFGIIHGISFSFAMSFSEPFSILPVFLETFGISKITIGLFISIIKAGSSFPQLIVAKSILSKKTGKPILFIAIWIRWLAWGIISLSIFLWGNTSQYLILIIFVTMLFIYSFAGGVANVPFFNMIAKAIPPEKRGTFFGLRQLFGGIAAIIAGFLVKYILSIPGIEFPKNYGYLFFITFILLTFGYIALSLFKEPEHKIIKKHLNNQINIQTVLYYIKTNHSLRRIILSQIASQGLFISMPFFILYAKHYLKFPAALVGYFIISRMLGGTISNFLWAKLSNTKGNRIVVRLSALFGLLSIIIAIFGNSIISFLLVFIFIGFFYNGANIGYNNYIMEFGDDSERPKLLSIQGTLLFPVYFFPFIGGILIKTIGYIPTFILSSIFLLISFILTYGICEPRIETCDIKQGIDYLH